MTEPDLTYLETFELTDPPPDISARVRTWCYLLGAIIGLGVAPAMLALDLPKWGAALACIAGAANALAFGYRPTKAQP